MRIRFGFALLFAAGVSAFAAAGPASAHTLRFPSWAAPAAASAFRQTRQFDSVSCRLADGGRHVRCSARTGSRTLLIVEHRISQTKLRADLIDNGRVVRSLQLPFSYP
jgi:hypothetical protein